MFPDITLPASVQALILVIAFFTPGFIAGKVFELCFPRGEVPERVRLLEYVTLSCINYAFCSPLVLLVVQSQLWLQRPIWFALCTLFILLIAPVVVGSAIALATKIQWFRRLARRAGIQAPHHLGTAWEWFFREHPNSRWWVVIRLRSGIMVYGFFGWNSYMGNDPGERDLYLERECEVDKTGRFRVIEDAGGIYVQYADIEAIAFRPVQEKAEDGQNQECGDHDK